MSTETSITIGPVRLSFANIWEPKAAKGSTELRYSLSALFDPETKEGKKILDQIENAIDAAKDKGAKLLDGVPEKKLKMPLHDGEDVMPGDPNYKGMLVLNCNNKTKPGIVDRNSKPIMDQSKVYSGCYAYINVNMFAFDNVSKGISCSLQHVMFFKDGERLDGRKTAEQAFEGLNFTDEEPTEGKRSKYL